MCKSDTEVEAGRIMHCDNADAVRSKFKRAINDSGTEIRFAADHPAIINLLTIFQLLTEKTPDEIEEHFGGRGYAKLKEELADVTIEFLRPFQERVHDIDDGKLNEILERGAARAESISRPTLAQAKKNMGLIGAVDLRRRTAEYRKEHGLWSGKKFRVQSLDCRLTKPNCSLN